MIYVIVRILVSFIFAASCHAQSLPGQSPSFDLTSVSVSQAVQLIYTEALKQNYVVDPEVLTDQRLVSFRYKQPAPELHAFVVDFLHSLGYSVQMRGAVEYVFKTKEVDKQAPEESVFIYTVKHRTSGYLSRLLEPLFRGRFTLNRSVKAAQNSGVNRQVPDGSAAALIDQDADVLVYVGSQKDIEQLKGLLVQLDVDVPQVMVSAAVYEVATSKTEGSAVQLALSLLGGRVGASFGSDVSALSQKLTVSAGGFTGVLSVLNNDSHFNVVTRPSVVVSSGQQARLFVGASVPTLGNTSFQGASGTAVQSVNYQDSGTILSVMPTVKADVIDLNIDQQISNFQKTVTGVTGTDTLLKRQLATALSMQSGGVLLVGGLTQKQKTNTHSDVPVFSFLSSHQDTDSLLDVLIVISVQRIGERF
jgi:general secretion pathway protein D